MHTYRWHPALEASVSGPAIGPVPVHLQQSDLDGACGLHCAFMALLLFGLIERHDLDQLPTSRKKRQKALWRKAERRYFHGAHPKHLQAVFALYPDVHCSVQEQDCVSQALAVLAAAGLAIVNIHNPELDHWVLAVGTGGKEQDGCFQPLWLLILDPAHGPLPLTPWNGLLSTRMDRKQRHAYDTPAGRNHVSIKTIVALRRIDHVD